jgi:hypothetical protein
MSGIIQHEVHGPTTVVYNGVTLGYSRNGVTVRIDPFWENVPSDDFGGTGSSPSDAQFLGAIGRVVVDLTKYCKTAVQALSKFLVVGNDAIPVGKLPSIGTFVRQNGHTGLLSLVGSNRTVRFQTAFPRDAQELNLGTKYTSFMASFEAWMDNTTNRQLFDEITNS